MSPRHRIGRTTNGITFGYDTDSPDVDYPLSDGIAIKKYNGIGCGRGAPGDCEPGEWLDWNTTTDPPRWEFNEGRGYVAHLAAQTPCE